MSIKSLVIKSKDTPPAKEHTWESMGININNFTRNIITQSVAHEGSEDLSKLGSVISGMPTVFARANMFKLSLQNVQDKNQANTGLMAFYETLISEWRGLITCIALNPDKIEMKRIHLKYSDGQNISSVPEDKLFEPTGSFGTMLFDRAPMWSNPSDDNPSPFLDVIIYTKSDGSKMVIGGTNPDSLFFTSANYNMSGEASAYVNEVKTESKVQGFFTDPLSHKTFDPKSLHKLYSYVNHMLAKMNDFTNFFAPTKLIEASYHNDVIGNLTNWIKEMEAFMKEKDIAPFENSEIPQISHFQAPYSIFGNYSTSIAALDGVIYDGGVEGGVTFNPKELLLPNTTRIAMVDDDGDANFLKNRPLLLLRADVEGEPNEYRHFMLPISPKGIKVFGKNLSAVLGLNDNTTVKSRMKAIYNTNGTLSVEIKLFSQTKSIGDIKEMYKTTNDDIYGKDLLLWPNFISPKWNKYFLFSEMPHNSPNWQAVPFCLDNNSENQVMIMDPSDAEMPQFIARDGKEANTDKAKLKVDFNPSKLSGNPYEYEIYESVNPFKGFQLMHQNNLVGYAVIEYGSSPSSPLRIVNDMSQLKEAHLGVDFGSTNSAIAYRVGDTGNAEGFQFKNRRVSLLAPGGDDKNNDVSPAGEDEVFFFQNDEIQANQIKSVLALHDQNRIRDDKGQGNIIALASEEVKGGFPCFEKNLPIEDSTNHEYLLKFRSIGQAKLIHNMKWNSDASSQKTDTAYRKAYLKSLLLQVYSDLFDKGLYPSTLKWAYPSAMGDNLIGDYNSIWQELKEVNPLVENHDLDVKTGSGTFNFDGDDDWGSAGGSQDDSWGASSSSGDASGDSGWGSDSGSSDWGAAPSAAPEPKSSGWGEEKPKIKKQKEISIDDSAIEFDFQLIDDNRAMTESCAVANFLCEDNSVDISTAGDALTICFDIGGSTTDILVLAKMNGPDGPGLSMVKQSSIRFAAQRVAQATKFSPNFKTVLTDELNRKGVRVEGINNGGANKYNENTAPYYFEQLVDRLNEDEYDNFYRILGTECKEMVAVNVYVTGLIVFYAGQIAKKVKSEIDRSPNRTAQWQNPKIQLQFTGKGSRIMDWLGAINQDASRKYYMDMFINGFGGMDAAKQHLGGPPVFQSRTQSSNVKYEVAKGLASRTSELYVPKSGQKPLEVIGEDGFVLFSGGAQTKMTAENSISTDLMEGMGDSFAFRPENPNAPCPRFMQFAQLYFKLATHFFGLNVTKEEFMRGFTEMNITDYIRLMPEFKEASKNKKGFDFVAPIIILEGMKFLEKVILPAVKRK